MPLPPDAWGPSDADLGCGLSVVLPDYDPGAARPPDGPCRVKDDFRRPVCGVGAVLSLRAVRGTRRQLVERRWVERVTSQDSLMTSTAEDYAWFVEDYALGLNFCLTFVRGVTADQVLERLGGREPVELVGARWLEDGAGLVQWRPDTVGGDGVFYADRITGLTFMAATSVGQWSMLIEPGGFLCTEQPVVQALSKNGEMVSLYYNENNAPRFFWARDGVVLVDFDPLAAGWRGGAGPGRLDGELQRLGFDMSTEEIDPSDPRWSYDELWQPRVLALMHHLTGVSLTGDLLQTAVFRCAAVPDPSGWAWVTADPANIAPDTAEGLAVDVRARLRGYAEDPGRTDDDQDDTGTTWMSHTGWASHGVTDERLLATGLEGETLYVNDRALLMALADAHETVHRQVIRWARLWGFTEAELKQEPWFAQVREAVEADRPITEHDRLEVAHHLDPLPVGPEIGPDGRLDRGSRHQCALWLLFDPEPGSSLAQAAETLVKAAGVGNYRYDRLAAALRRDFPELQ
jgi:uncharacterized protein DUF6461